MYDELIYWMRYCSDDKPICEKMYDCPFYDESENNSAYYLCGERMLKKAADAIEELLAEREENYADSWKMAFEVERDAHRWIPVTERLPEKDGTFITAYSKGGVSQNWYMTFHHGGGKWYLNSEDTGEVTHWTPLPEPPKDGAE